RRVPGRADHGRRVTGRTRRMVGRARFCLAALRVDDLLRSWHGHPAHAILTWQPFRFAITAWKAVPPSSKSLKALPDGRGSKKAYVFGGDNRSGRSSPKLRPLRKASRPNFWAMASATASIDGRDSSS